VDGPGYKSVSDCMSSFRSSSRYRSRK